jgi:hypothetical protein
MKDYYDLCASLFDINEMGYNSEIKQKMMNSDLIEFHRDDDFVWHHPRLAEALLGYRKINNFPTKIYSNNRLVGEISA